MRIILLKDIPKIGKKYDIKDVADGHARNFLIPKGLAKVATKSALKQMEDEKAKMEILAEADLAKTEEIVAMLDGQELEIPAKIGEDGKLYGSITSQKISKVLEGKGFKIQKNQVKIDNPIKEIGEYEVIIEFSHGLEAKVKIIVTEETDQI